MKFPVQRVYGAVLGLCLLVSPSFAEDIQKVEVAGIKNFTVIADNAGFAGSLVGFGGATEALAVPELKNRGFVTVINLRRDSEEGAEIAASRAAAEAAGLKYVHLPFDPGNASPGVVEEFLAVVGEQANQPVYIHCGSATRASALWMIGRVLEDGWEFDEAVSEANQIAGKPEQAISFSRAYLALPDSEEGE